MKRAGSGSASQWYGSSDPDPVSTRHGSRTLLLSNGFPLLLGFTGCQFTQHNNINYVFYKASVPEMSESSLVTSDDGNEAEMMRLQGRQPFPTTALSTMLNKKQDKGSI